MTDIVSFVSEDVNSFIATYLVSKKGIICRLLYFDYTSYVDKRKYGLVVKNYNQMLNLAKESIKSLHVIPFSKSYEEVKKICPKEYISVILRRLQFRIENELYRKLGGFALVLGERLSKENSIERFIIEDEVSDFPIFRPLIGLDESYLEKLKKKLGLFEIDDLNLHIDSSNNNFSLDEIKEYEKKLLFPKLLKHAFEGIREI